MSFTQVLDMHPNDWGHVREIYKMGSTNPLLFTHVYKGVVGLGIYVNHDFQGNGIGPA